MGRSTLEEGAGANQSENKSRFLPFHGARKRMWSVRILINNNNVMALYLLALVLFARLRQREKNFRKKKEKQKEKERKAGRETKPTPQ
jgi:hypothetical protein